MTTLTRWLRVLGLVFMGVLAVVRGFAGVVLLAATLGVMVSGKTPPALHYSLTTALALGAQECVLSALGA